LWQAASAEFASFEGAFFVKSWIFGGAAMAALICGSARAQAPHSLADDAAAFGARPAVTAPSLSPDGSSVMYITPGPGPKTYAVISNLQTGKTSVMTSADGNPEVYRWCNYSASDRAVCRISALTHQNSAILGFQRLISMNTDGTDGKLLGQHDSFYDEALRQTDGVILDWNNARDGKVLMEREYVPQGGQAAIGSRLARKKSGLGVDLVDTRNLQASTVEIPRDEASAYMTDGRGNVRVMAVEETRQNGSLTGRVKYFYRTPGSRDWQTLVDYDRAEDQVEPLAIDADINAVYALKKKDGRRALYTIKLDGSLAEKLIAENPRVDIGNVIRIGEGLRVIGYSYADETRHTVYFDPEFKALAESLSKALPKLPIVEFVDASSDGNKLLIFAGSDSDPGRYYLFDRSTKQLNEAMLERPQLEGRTLASVKAVTIPAADGAQIPAYLTLPPGRSDAKNLPAVILPHGGPSSRDEWGFDFLSQFLAARGYAVLQPEYRGSAGYGDKWLNENGFKNWRTSMSDIAASAKWLASQGIADPKREAILGWSYGGYAALMEAETDPQLYKAVIAVAPVTDLAMLKDDAKAYTSAAVVEDFVGSGPHIVEGSPLQHVDRIQAPVLLVHGDLDANVAFRHSEKMASALQSAGKEVEFLQYKGLDHQLQDSSVRAEFLTHMGQLLDRTIGH
jgi:dipeptidyl aminopeptidase/acylaminoacyl peptidase